MGHLLLLVGSVPAASTFAASWLLLQVLGPEAEIVPTRRNNRNALFD